MAKITKLPGLNIIRGFKGTLDYYLWMGIPCVRSWPRSPGHDRTPAVEAQWPAFTYAAKAWPALPMIIKEAYNQMSVGTNLTGRDFFTKFFINTQGISLEDL